LTSAGELPGKIYDAIYKRSIEDPEGFWGEAAEELHWFRKWDKVLDDSVSPFFKWFTGGTTNLCYNALDRHILAGKGDKIAVMWESTAQGQSRIISYDELYKEVNRFAGVLKNLGIHKGDRVLIYLPMVPEAFVSMLACTRIGAIHSIVFAGFSIDSLAERISDAQPKVLITADGGMRRNKPVPLKEIVDSSLEKSPVETVIVLDRGIVDIQMKEGRDHYWADLIRDKGEEYVEPEQLESSHPSYILYTSGTTGKPKGVVRDTGGYMVALYNSMKQIYGIKEGDVYWATSDIGWVVGHSYIVYAPLLLGISSVMYEGTPDYPDHGVFWKVVEKYGVSVMFSAPTAIRMLMRFGIEKIKSCDTSSLRYLFLAGEALDKTTWQWATDALDNRPVIDHYWLTETGWPVVANMVGLELLPIKPGSPTKAVVGYNLAVVDSEGKVVPPNTKGFLVTMAPLPPGTLMTIWGDDERYKREYWQQFEGRLLFSTGDFATVDEDGYLTMYGRADEVLNVAGHRLGTREIEEIILSHPAIAEAGVVGVASKIKGEEPICLAVLKEGFESSNKLRLEIKNLIRQRIGSVASIKDIRFVHMLPKTRSGKYMRRVIKAVYEEQELADLSTIEDGASIEEVREAIREMKKSLR